MSNSSSERNKTIVLEAFETLFNKRDYAARRNAFGHRTTFSTAHTSQRVGMVYSR
jgi:hypothetical protein